MTGTARSDQPAADARERRWAEVLDLLVAAVPAGPAGVVVDGSDAHSGVVADRLAAALRAGGRSCVRLPPDGGDTWQHDGTVAVADGPRRRAQPPADGWTVVVWLRTAPPRPSGPHGGGDGGGDRSGGAHVVVDLHDPGWPVVRHVDAGLADRDRWYLVESRAFFGVRAATWDTRFGDDQPAYAAAVAEGGLCTGGVVIDVGCGTGRALPALRAAVGPTGTVVGLDITPQMLAVAQLGNAADATGLILADACRLPFADAAVDGIFAAGLIMHLPDTDGGLRELARVTRPGGRLVLFHPSGRAALAARHGRPLRPDEPLAEGPLRGSAGRTGWRVTNYDDPPHRFLAIAERAA